MVIRRLLIGSIALLMLVSLALGSGNPVLAQSLGKYDAYVATNTLSLRTSPNTAASVIVILQKGDRMYIDGRDVSKRWVHVKTEYDQVGWIAKDFLVISYAVIIDNLKVLDGGAPTGGGTQPTSPAGSTPKPTATNAAANPPPVVSGRVGGGFELGGQVRDLNDSTANYMRRAGMKWVKHQATMGDGSAGLIGQAHAKGFKVLFSVIGARNSILDDGYQNSYAGFVADLAGAGADAIEVWNEENIDREWPTGQISPPLYVKLLAKAYNAIKSRNRNTIVIIGAPAPTGGESYWGVDRAWNDDRYVAGLARAGAGNYADCVGVHYNEGIVSPYRRSGDPRGDNYPTRYFSSMLARGLSGFRLPACFTELGFLSPEGYGSLPGGFEWAKDVTVNQQAQWLAEAAVLASNSGRVRLMIVFNIDFSGFGADPQGGYAMVRPGGGCPACDTLGKVVR